jgi:hypothetical protein
MSGEGIGNPAKLCCACRASKAPQHPEGFIAKLPCRAEWPPFAAVQAEVRPPNPRLHPSPNAHPLEMDLRETITSE